MSGFKGEDVVSKKVYGRRTTDGGRRTKAGHNSSP